MLTQWRNLEKLLIRGLLDPSASVKKRDGKNNTYVEFKE
jgi:hypothetical protein